MNNSVNLKSVEGAVWAGLVLLELAAILLIGGATFQFVSGSISEANASTLGDSIINSTNHQRENTGPSTPVTPMFDHSVVNREGIPAEPEPSSPMSAAYFHV